MLLQTAATLKLIETIFVTRLFWDFDWRPR
jgi:hypothetical protein